MVGLSEDLVFFLSALQRHGGDELLHFIGQSLFLGRLILIQCSGDLEQKKVLLRLDLCGTDFSTILKFPPLLCIICVIFE